MALKVIQDWEDRCSELRMRMDEAYIEWQRTQAVLNRALDDEPRVCVTCGNWDNGICSAFRAAPPIEFQETPNACNKWELLVPF
jgi:hypothetical protein